MNEPENKALESSELADLRGQCNVLSRHVMMLLMALFVVSGTVTVFLGVQARRMGNDLRGVRPQFNKITEATAKEKPFIERFMAELENYGNKHPDFKPIISRFKLSETPPAGETTSSIPMEATPPQ